MEIKPAIPDRTTEELLEIIEKPEEWRPEIVSLAQDELKRRRTPLDTQKLRRKNVSKFERRITAIKSRASYTKLEKLLIVLFGPILIILLSDLFLFHAGEGYKRKNRQGWTFFLLGIVLWIAVLSIIFN